MQVQCILCDKIDDINDNSFQAKRLMNRQIATYLCPTCYERIAENTKKRHETGNFKLFQPKKNHHDIFNNNKSST